MGGLSLAHILALVIFFTIPTAILGIVLVVGLRNKSDLGINLESVTCPRCGALIPMALVPKNSDQATWGSWTCACGCEIDKWGREIDPTTGSAPSLPEGAQFCTACGIKLDGGGRFCPGCGRKTG